MEEEEYNEDLEMDTICVIALVHLEIRVTYNNSGR
jgi:hypothetical protein